MPLNCLFCADVPLRHYSLATYTTEERISRSMSSYQLNDCFMTMLQYLTEHTQLVIAEAFLKASLN